MVFGFRDNRPTFLCFFARHPWRASHFLLLAQEKVTKEKGTPAGAVGRRPTARGRYGGSLTGHPWPDSELAGLLPATLRAFSSASSPRPRGTPEIKSRRAKAHPIKAIPKRFPSPACGGRCRRRKGALLIWAPCGAAKGGRKGPKGRREGSRRFRCRPGWPVSGTRPPVANPQRSCGRPTRGAPSLWLLSLGQARESDPRAGMRVEPHRDVRRLSRRTPEQSKAKALGPGLRRDDEVGGPSPDDEIGSYNTFARYQVAIERGEPERGPSDDRGLPNTIASRFSSRTRGPMPLTLARSSMLSNGPCALR